MSVNSVLQFYRTVIEDVVNNVRETFLDDGVDEQVLVELKQIWENKLMQSKAVPAETARVEPEKTSHSARSSAAAAAKAEAAAVAAAAAAAATTAAAAALASTNTVVTAPQQVSTAASIVTQPTVQYRYTTAGQGADGQKPMTFTLPQGVTMGPGQTFTLPAHLMQHATNAGGLMMSSSAAAAAQALPAGMAASLLQSAMTINASGMITQQQGDRTVSYQTVTAEQLAKQGYMVSMAPGMTAQTLQAAGAATGHHLHPVQVTSVNNAGIPSETDNGAAKMVRFLTGGKSGGIVQLDGANDTTDDEDDDDDELNDDELDDEQNEEEEVVGEEEDPLNSEDDVSDDDPSELFDTDNVIVCQYDKITRSRNKWKFHLKDGIMNVQGKDYVFQKACGDAEW